jgi:hypothetical protein
MFTFCSFAVEVILLTFRGGILVFVFVKLLIVFNESFMLMVCVDFSEFAARCSTSVL